MARPRTLEDKPEHGPFGFIARVLTMLCHASNVTGVTQHRPPRPPWSNPDEDRFKQGGLVEFGDVAAPRYTRVIADDPELPYVVRAWVEMTSTGPRLADLRIQPREGVEVTARSLRAFRLQPLLDQVATQVRPMRRRGDAWAVNRDTASQDRASYRRALARQQEGTRRWLLTDDHLAKVAEVYRAALATGRNPTQAVQDHWRLPKRGQAQRWVSRARDEGHLGPAPGRRMKGEQQ